MQLKTILNRVQKFKSFVYEPARWVNEAGQPAVEVELHGKRPQPIVVCVYSELVTCTSVMTIAREDKLSDSFSILA